MARIRSVKPEFWDDRKLAKRLSRDARLLYIALWNFADEHSRLQGDPSYIKGHCLPYDEDIDLLAIEKLLDEIETAGRLQRYDHEGDPFIYLPKLKQHQRLESEKVASRLPDPPEMPYPDKPAPSPKPRADDSAPDADESSLLYVAGSREHVAGGRGVAPDEPTRAARRPDPVWDAMLEVTGVDPASITGSSRGAYNRAAGDLRQAGATATEIRRRAEVYRARWPDVSLTPTALARRWPECDQAPVSRPRTDDTSRALAESRRQAEAAERKALS